MMQKWDYRSVSYQTDGDFIDMGKEGWELVQILAIKKPNFDEDEHWVGFFKRPVEG